MTREKELWQLEEQFWLSGAEFYEQTLAPDALMVLPQPAGILDRASTIKSIGSGARWTAISFTQQHCLSSAPDLTVLAYAVQADRGKQDFEYAAQCSSTYSRGKGGWRLVLHHQSPLSRDNGGRA